MTHQNFFCGSISDWQWNEIRTISLPIWNIPPQNPAWSLKWLANLLPNTWMGVWAAPKDEFHSWGGTNLQSLLVPECMRSSVFSNANPKVNMFFFWKRKEAKATPEPHRTYAGFHSVTHIYKNYYSLTGSNPAVVFVIHTKINMHCLESQTYFSNIRYIAFHPFFLTNLHTIKVNHLLGFEQISFFSVFLSLKTPQTCVGP